ncbi:MAG: hypothetical protein KIC88_08195 [Acinetobacter sp.]|nr:hypothetical protein [Acinetobacter sp.]
MKNDKILATLNCVYKIPIQNNKELDDDVIELGISFKAQTGLAISREKFLLLKNDIQEKITVENLSENFICKSVQDYLLSEFPNYGIESYNSKIEEINRLKKIKTNILYQLYNVDLDDNELILSIFEMYKPQYFISEHPNPLLYSNINEQNRVTSDNALHVILILKDIEMYKEDEFSKNIIIEQKVSDFICFLAVALGNKRFAQAITTKFSCISNSHHLINDDYKILTSSMSVSESTYINSRCTLLTDNFSNVHEKLFNLLSSSKTKIEEKIYKSTLWLGKSLITKNLSDSFLQVAIALECLLSRQERGYFIQPSITVTISETLAFLIGDNADERKAYFKQLKDLYAKRSSIVHSGNTSIDIEVYYDFFNLVKEGIYAMIKLVQENQYTTINEIYDYIEFLKFS